MINDTRGLNTAWKRERGKVLMAAFHMKITIMATKAFKCQNPLVM